MQLIAPFAYALLLVTLLHGNAGRSWVKLQVVAHACTICYMSKGTALIGKPT